MWRLRSLALVWSLATMIATGRATADGSCPPTRPTLSGPTAVQAGETYSLSWTNVLVDRADASDDYLVERCTDPAFASGVDRLPTNRSAINLPPAPTGAQVVYHRVVVRTSCPSTGAAIVSNVLEVAVDSDCPTPGLVGDITITPSNPPAYTTYVVSWDTGGNGAPGPGGGPTGLKFRLRRAAPSETEPREWVLDRGSVSFNDPPGEYSYQVRAELPCGSGGPWSAVRKVVVDDSSRALILVSEPKPIAIVGPVPANAPGKTSFVVRNGGTTSFSVTASADQDSIAVDPQSFTLGAGATQTITARVPVLNPTAAPFHTGVTLRAGPTSLRVPIDFTIGKMPAGAPVVWNDTDLSIDSSGDSVLRSVYNPGPTEAAFVASVRQPWISVASGDGLPWDRPLASHETRVIRISVDRLARRGEYGTEVGAISLATVGFPENLDSLIVVDDGPRVALSGAGGASGPGATPPKTRLLYASMPNAADARGIGRFTADLWLSNTDAISPIDVTILFTPLAGGASSEKRQIDLTLAPGETRRFRNFVGNVIRYEGAGSVELQSAAPTLSATAIVNNQPLGPTNVLVPLGRRGINPDVPIGGTPTPAGATGSSSGTVPKGQFGFEMRPTVPGEGVGPFDTSFSLSGLAYEPGRRRTNVLLFETSGADTTVLLRFYDERGNPLRNGSGQETQMTVTVPASSTRQINYDAIWDPRAAATSPYYYAIVEWKSGTIDGFGIPHGSVVPMATVIDEKTQDASLRVGVSTKALDPGSLVPPAGSVPAARRALGRDSLASLPFQGGPPPLLFPVVHSPGAPLQGGVQPFWKTRVTFTNTGLEDRLLVLKLLDRTGNAEVKVSTVILPRSGIGHVEDLLQTAFLVPPNVPAYGAIEIDAVQLDGTQGTWKDVDIQTEVYTVDPSAATTGEYKTGMEAYSYLHGYSSFQSNLGTVQIEGAETSSRFRTNLILNEVGGAPCTVSVSAYLPGSFVPLATKLVQLDKFDYISTELFRNLLGLDLTELTDVRVVARQVDGDGVFMGFISKIDRATGDPANIFLRPAAAGTGR